MKNKLIYIVGGSVITGSLFLSGTALAAAKHQAPRGIRSQYAEASHTPSIRPALFGTVTAISGSNVTVEGRVSKGTVQTTYTVDAASAKITKGFGQGASVIPVSTIAVGDRVAVFGAISGTTITATSISDSAKPAASAPKSSNGRRMPNFAGVVTSATGGSFTFLNHARNTSAASTSYAVTTTSATTFLKKKAGATAADITAGESVVVIGTLDASTNTITATKVYIIPATANGKIPFGRKMTGKKSQ